jgi:hypothetical protein
MSEQDFQADSAFERRFSELLNDYAVLADRPFDAIEVASAAVAATPRLAPWARPGRLFRPISRSAMALVLLMIVLTALLGVFMVGGPPNLPDPVIPSGPRFGHGELLLATNGRVLRINVATGQRRVVAEGWVLAMSPDRSRFLRATAAANPTGWPGPTGFRGPLVVTDAAGNDLDQVALGASAATWSPDGRYVALEGLFAPDSNFAVWDMQTGATTFLPFTRHPELVLRPTWAPDGRHLLVLDRWGAVITDPLGETRQVVVEGASGLMYWSPDGAYILRDPLSGTLGAKCCLSLRSVQREGTIGGPCCQSLRSVRPDLSTTEVGLLPFVQLPSWSPDSRHYAGITAEGVTVASLDHPDEGRVIYRSSDADDPRHQVPLQFVEWSPDGRQIAFVGFDPADETGERLAVIVVDADGGGARVIATLDGLPFPGAIGVLDW